MLYLFVPSNDNEISYPLIVFAYVILTVAIAVRIFQAFLKDQGRLSCTGVISALFLTALAITIFCGFGFLLLLVIYDFSRILGWLAVLFGGWLFAMDTRSQHLEQEARERSHRNWQARHKDDLCNNCDAYRTANGEIRHSPSCSNR